MFGHGAAGRPSPVLADLQQAPGRIHPLRSMETSSLCVGVDDALTRGSAAAVVRVGTVGGLHRVQSIH